MRLTPASVVCATLLSACAGRLYSTLNATSTGAPDDVFTCVQDQFKSLGYSRVQYDVSERWFVGQRVDPSAKVASSLYRRTVNRLEARVSPNASGQTGLQVSAHTFDEFTTQRGFSQEERAASETAKQDAAALVQACSM